MDRGPLHPNPVGRHPVLGGLGMEPGCVEPGSLRRFTNPLRCFLNPLPRRLPSPTGLLGMIDQVKVDLVKYHHHPMIGTPTIADGIRLYSKADTIAMKVAAIMKRLQHYTVQNFIDFYSEKYPSQQLMISVPFALVYFDDAEESEEHISLEGQTWGGVKSFIRKKLNVYLK